ncbi:MAG: hypothetical protein IPF53_08060 [Blastocatellia bacterium]|nr:hypothetical protein [Blastocatellia bacterium]
MRAPRALLHSGFAEPRRGKNDPLRDIVDDDRRAGEVIRRLWTLLRVRLGRLLDVDLNLTVAGNREARRKRRGPEGVTVEFRLVEGLPSVRGDRIQLSRSFSTSSSMAWTQ